MPTPTITAISSAKRANQDWAWPVAMVAGAGAGAAALTLPVSVLLLTPIVILGLWIMARWPEYGILAIFSYTSTILSEEVLPPLPIGVGSLHLSDLLVLYLFIVLGVQLLITRRLKLHRTPLDLPMLIFIVICIGSTATGIAKGIIPFDDGTRNLRYAGYLVIFFLVTNLIVSEAQLRRLWAGVMILATLTAAASLLQTFIGTEMAFIPGRVEALRTQGAVHEGIARIIPPGESLFYIAIIMATLAMARERTSALLSLARFVLIAIGLILTYRRMIWGSAIFALFAAILLVHPEQRAKILRQFSLVFFIAALTLTGLFIAAPHSKVAQSIQATGERLTSLFDLDMYRRGDPYSQTLEQRAVENSYAIQQLLPPSLFGNGLGFSYRPCLNIDRRDCENPNYLHNTYLAILVKLGLVGLFTFLWIIIVTLQIGSKRFRHPPIVDSGDSWFQQINLGCTLAFAALLPAMLLEPYVLVWNWSPVIALLLGTIQWPRLAQNPLARRVPARHEESPVIFRVKIS